VVKILVEVGSSEEMISCTLAMCEVDDATDSNNNVFTGMKMDFRCYRFPCDQCLCNCLFERVELGEMKPSLVPATAVPCLQLYFFTASWVVILLWGIRQSGRLVSCAWGCAAHRRWAKSFQIRLVVYLEADATCREADIVQQKLNSSKTKLNVRIPFKQLFGHEDGTTPNWMQVLRVVRQPRLSF
jgi:hypothetical protein